MGRFPLVLVWCCAALGACGDLERPAGSFPEGVWRADASALEAEIDRLAALGLSGPDLDMAKEIANHWIGNRAEFVVRGDGRGEVRSTVGNEPKSLYFHLEPSAVGTELRTWSLVYRLKIGGVDQESRGFTLRQRGERLEVLSRVPGTQIDTTLHLVRSPAR